MAPGLGVLDDLWFEQLMSEHEDSPRHNTEGLVSHDGRGEYVANAADTSEYVGQPFPLFSGPAIVQSEVSDESEWASQFIVGNVGGLYLWPEGWWEDAARLVLPFAVSSGDAAGNGETWSGSNDALYDRPECPFLPHHGPRLFEILMDTPSGKRPVERRSRWRRRRGE